jgi:hypothetical protein
MAATNFVSGFGGDTPLGVGAGGDLNGTAAGGTGVAGQGFGAGGGGGKAGSSTTTFAGGAGAPGLVVIEY